MKHIKLRLSLFFFYVVVTITACQRTEVADNKAAIVHIAEDKQGYYLKRNGNRYFVKGAVGTVHLDYLKACGGNTINVYHRNVTDSLLDAAHDLGIAVTITLNIGRPYQGADYSDAAFVANQRSWVSNLVEKYKDHPALLFWIIGNEVHLARNSSAKAWKEINYLSKMIHELDPNHPTTATIAAFDRKAILELKFFCRDIDFISFNAHHKAYLLRRELHNLLWGWDRAYLISEWTGPVYWHESESTPWGAVIEPSSTKKAGVFAHNYFVNIADEPRNCLGGFVFYWGQKQERTHTMFSLIVEDEYKTQALEVLHYFWRGEEIKNYSPRINEFYIRDYNNVNDIYLNKDDLFELRYNVEDPENDSLQVKVQIFREGDYYSKFGGDDEFRPPLVLEKKFHNVPDSLPLAAPAEEGAYRIFFYVFDEGKNVATANIPFYVLPV